MLTVTGASGRLGRLVVLGLLDAGVPADEVVAVVRDPAKAADLDGRGVQVRRADYDDAAALTDALAGTDRLLLVSGTELGRRVEQHANVLKAAAAAGVELVAYTSGPKAEDSPLAVAPDHIATERLGGGFGPAGRLAAQQLVPRELRPDHPAGRRDRRGGGQRRRRPDRGGSPRRPRRRRG